MRSQLFVHQKNHVSFSYPKSKLTKENLHRYIENQFREDYTPMIQHDPSMYLHVVKDGIYRMGHRNMYAHCSGEQLRRVYHQSDSVYYFLMKNLYLNLFSVHEADKTHGTGGRTGGRTGFDTRQTNIQYVCSTLYPEDILEINQDYYKITIRDQHQPLYLQSSARLYDESGHRRAMIDIVHRMGRRRILGMNSEHEYQSFDIDRVENITSDEDNITVLDTPFYSIGIVKEVNERANTVLMNQILVDLD